MTIIPRSNLQPLNSKFLKLPYQAVKAKLVGKRRKLSFFFSPHKFVFQILASLFRKEF